MEQINLNLIPGRALPVCHVSQYDVGRQIRCNLFEGDQVFALATGDTAEVHVRKPDNTVVTASLTVVNAQTYLDIVTTQQMDAVAGSNLCEIQLKRSGNTLGTLNFIMEVEADPMDGGFISRSEIHDLQAQADAAVNNAITPYQKNILKDIQLELPEALEADGYLLFSPLSLPAGTYTLYIDASTDNPNLTYYCVRILKNPTYSSAGIIASVLPTKGSKTGVTFTINETAKSIAVMSATTAGGGSGYHVTITDMRLYYGYYVDPTKYYPVEGIINTILGADGVCNLPEGNFFINKITMPDDTALLGSGEATKLYFNTALTGNAIEMGSRCQVSNLQIYGDDSDITLPSSSDPQTDLISGDIWNAADGYQSLILITPQAPGTYTLEVNATSDNPNTTNVWVKVLKTQYYGSANVIYSTTVTKGSTTKLTFTVDDSILSIFVFANSSVSGSSGYNVTVSSASLYWEKVGSRHAISWSKSTNFAGIVSNCYISRFTGSAIRLQETGYDIHRGLMISNCYLTNNNCGIFFVKNSEFNKIINCIIAMNYYGVLNRSGNNNMTNCGIDANVVGIQVDNAEGSNGGHGIIEGCSINHSDNSNGYGLIIRGTGRMLVSCCNLYYSKVLLEKTNGNVLNGCGFGNSAGWEIVDGTCSLFVGCMVIDSTQTPITIQNNTKLKIVNCYTRNGDPVDWF